MTNNLLLPSEIPWNKLKGKDLEELLYWLFDSMGAKDLEWRIGGKGSGSPDQGRDLECSFYISSPEGNLTKQKWWIEAKGRSETVEPLEVKDAVINASGKSEVDILVIATNSLFSNPTRDWVKEWQANHPRPSIKLWEKTDLERYCSKNPIAVIRLFGKALSPQGKLEVSKTKLWDYASFTDEPTLINLWEARQELKISSRSLIALIASEMANGDINSRSWGIFIAIETLAESISDGLLNFLYLVYRANENGIRQIPYLNSLVYLTLVCCERIGPEQTAKLLTKVWDEVEGIDYPEEVRKYILKPVIRHLRDQIRDVCVSDCRRVSSDKILLSESEVLNYWDRLSNEEKKKRKKHDVLVLESHTTPCKVGFSVNKDKRCPLCNEDNPEEHISETLKVIEKVVNFRFHDRNNDDDP